ncbi:MAG: hypothetical protein AAF125_23900, partial [Chloroflexota bacterium]
MVEKRERVAALHRQVDRLSDTLLELQRRADQLSNLRLLVAVAGIVATAVTFTLSRVLGWTSLIVFGAVFVGLVVAHRRLSRAQRAREHWRTIKQTHIARAALEWDHIPPPPGRVRKRHMLEVDLDLDRLHRLVNTSTSRGGALKLRKWLIPYDPDPSATAIRQSRAEELVNAAL